MSAWRDPESYKPRGDKYSGGMIDSLFDTVERVEQAHARKSDPETSKSAAASISSAHISALQTMILLSLQKFGPMCDEKLFQRVLELNERDFRIGHISPSGCRSRRAELVEAGKVKDSGDRTVELTRRASIVWRLS